MKCTDCAIWVSSQWTSSWGSARRNVARYTPEGILTHRSLGCPWSSSLHWRSAFCCHRSSAERTSPYILIRSALIASWMIARTAKRQGLTNVTSVSLAISMIRKRTCVAIAMTTTELSSVKSVQRWTNVLRAILATGWASPVPSSKADVSHAKMPIVLIAIEQPVSASIANQASSSRTMTVSRVLACVLNAPAQVFVPNVMKRNPHLTRWPLGVTATLSRTGSSLPLLGKVGIHSLTNVSAI